MSTDLPSFSKPPLVETALSVQFKPLELLGNAHLGLFWNQYLRAEYPKVMDAEPIVPQVELLGADLSKRPRLPSFRIVASQGATRLQMVTESEQAMVQLQNGRLVYNWRRLKDGTYPRWTGVLPAFHGAFSKFQSFLAAEKIGAIEPTQWEIVYVNHMYKGREWQSPADVGRVFPGIIGAGATSVGVPEAAGCNWHFLLPEERGRLHIELSQGLTSEPEPQEVLVLQLTARGNATVETELANALTHGRAAIVRVFAEITGPEAHAMWEYKK